MKRVLAALILAVVSGFWNEIGEMNKPFRLGEARDWFMHAAAKFAGQEGFPHRAFVSHNGHAPLYIYYNAPERRVFMDARLEVCSRNTFEIYNSILQQMADQKVTAKVITGINGPQYQEWIDAIGAVGNGVTTASWFHSSVRYKSDDLFGDTQNFVKLFTAKYKSEPDFTQASGSAIGVILQMAIEKAGSLDRDKVRSVLANTEFKTFFAPVKFGPNGQANSYTPPIFQIQDKKAVVIYPDVIKQADLQPVAGR